MKVEHFFAKNLLWASLHREKTCHHFKGSVWKVKAVCKVIVMDTEPEKKGRKEGFRKEGRKKEKRERERERAREREPIVVSHIMHSRRR